VILKIITFIASHGIIVKVEYYYREVYNDLSIPLILKHVA
jgi:hypothetical protein